MVNVDVFATTPKILRLKLDGRSHNYCQKHALHFDRQYLLVFDDYDTFGECLIPSQQALALLKNNHVFSTTTLLPPWWLNMTYAPACTL